MVGATAYCDPSGADCVEPDPFLILTSLALGLIAEIGISIWGIAHGARTEGARWLWPFVGLVVFFLGLVLTASLT